MSRAIEVDTKTFVRFWLVILGFGLAGLFVWKAWEALIIIGISLFLAVAIRPLAQRINSLTKKNHATSSSVIAYALVIGFLGVIVALVGPVVIEQTTQFVQQLPDTFELRLFSAAAIWVQTLLLVPLIKADASTSTTAVIL